MKDIVVEQMLISAATGQEAHVHTFVAKTMERVRLEAGASTGHIKTSRFNNVFGRVKRLHGISLVLFIVAVLLTCGGITYAAIRFIPDLIGIDSKETNQRGQTEYTVNNFTECQKIDQTQANALKRFAVIQGAPELSDDEITKILQAKCELLLIDGIIRQTWPTHGLPTNNGQNLSQAVYARGNMLAKLESVNSTKLEIINPDSGQAQSFSVGTGQKLRAFNRTEPVELNTLHKGDTVMVVGEVAEISPNNPPEDRGVVGLIKLPLSLDYYTEKQRYIMDIPACNGNPDEFCPSTPSIDIYPRVGGEGATNPYLPKSPDSFQWEMREISGEVTDLSDNRLVLRSFSNQLYTVTLSENGISDYNANYSGVYIQQGTDAKVRVGSVVNVMYFQPPGSNPKDIKGDQVMRLNLQLQGVLDYKKQGLEKQY